MRDRFFEVLVLCNMFTDFRVVKVTKKLTANQSAKSNRNDSNENQ